MPAKQRNSLIIGSICVVIAALLGWTIYSIVRFNTPTTATSLVPTGPESPLPYTLASFDGTNLVVTTSEGAKTYTVSEATKVFSVVEGGLPGLSLDEIAPGSAILIVATAPPRLDSVLLIPQPTVPNSGEETLFGIVQSNDGEIIRMKTPKGSEVQIQASSARLLSIVESGMIAKTLEDIAVDQSISAIATRNGNMFIAREINL